MSSRGKVFSVLVVAFLIISLPAIAADERTGAVGRVTVSGAAVQWQPVVAADRFVLTVSGPNDFTMTREFAGGQPVVLRVQDLGSKVAEGSYVYELRAVPAISAEVKERLRAAREAGDDAAVARIQKEAHLLDIPVQAGGVMIRNGGFVTDSVEPPPASSPGLKPKPDSVSLKPSTNDVVTADDEIIQGSLCVGLDCVVNESFGFDTIRLKENNTRIKFDDTSTASGFPANDWQLTANDSNSGGLNKFSIDDITGGKTPFTTIAGAPTNSLFIASSGKVGFGNSSPGLNLHITATDTPAIRQEQTSGGGFTAQTWDIGANEANWFVRDLTGGSRLPLRIRPGAPTSSVDIAASGFVGMGTASPGDFVNVLNSNNGAGGVLVKNSSNGASAFARVALQNDTGSELGEMIVGSSTIVAPFSNRLSLYVPAGQTTVSGVNILAGTGDIRFYTNGQSTASERVRIDTSGRVGIGTTSPGAQLAVSNGVSTSQMNAGDTQFTVVSSRTLKENITPFATCDVLDKIASVPVVTYDFRDNGPKDKLGLIAEDFYQVLGRGDDKHINGQDVQMALWLAVQQLTAQNKELQQRISALESQLQQH